MIHMLFWSRVNQNPAEIAAVAYGTFEIPGSFEGGVYIPFSQLTDREERSLSLKSVRSWGFTTVMEQEQVVQYEIRDINFLGGSEASLKQSYFDIRILGDNRLTVPNAGTSISDYRAEVKDLDGNTVEDPVSFSLGTKTAGASISSGGALELDSNCPAGEIVIYAGTERSINAGKLILSLQHAGDGSENRGGPEGKRGP